MVVGKREEILSKMQVLADEGSDCKVHIVSHPPRFMKGEKTNAVVYYFPRSISYSAARARSPPILPR